eukprot:5591490-Ditylum_brightwellii.AAC.1
MPKILAPLETVHLPLDPRQIPRQCLQAGVQHPPHIICSEGPDRLLWPMISGQSSVSHGSTLGHIQGHPPG